MRQMKWMAGTAVLLLAFSGCAPVAEIEKDVSASWNNYNTYAWVESKASENSDGNNPASFAQLSVQNEANAQMQKKGWRLDNNNPDVLLSYDILVERNEVQRNEPVYTRPFVRYYYNPYFRRWGRIYYPSSFLGYDSYSVPVQEATLTLSMMDARTDKKIWQGWTTQQVNRQAMTKEEIRSGVKSIFRKFDENAK